MNWMKKIKEIQIKLLELVTELDEGDYWMHVDEEDAKLIAIEEWHGNDEKEWYPVVKSDEENELQILEICIHCGERPHICNYCSWETRLPPT